jgi:AcrR family transcriptional regulator
MTSVRDPRSFDAEDALMPERGPSTHVPGAKALRRRRGEPKRLLLETAKRLFADQDYRSITTREIAEQAGVPEPLLFRNFGSKAALFREAVVAPFVELVDAFDEEFPGLSAEGAPVDIVGRQFLGSLYDLLIDNRGLLTTLLLADHLGEEELSETGLREIGNALTILGQLGAHGIDRLHLSTGHPELAARSSVAMTMGMAAFGGSLFGSSPPSRDAVVEELTQMTLHGFLHRPAPAAEKRSRSSQAGSGPSGPTRRSVSPSPGRRSRRGA